MSAADKREEVEAAVRRFAAAADGCRHTGKCEHCEVWLTQALAAADAYAMALADQRVNRLNVGELKARLRLAEATADAAVRGGS